MKRSTIARTAAVGATCALAGAAAGIAGSSASTPRTSEAPGLHRWLKLGPFGGLGAALPFPGDAAGAPVHSDTVVPNEKGGFDTMTMDRGRFAALSGDQLTITEGTKTATYKTVTLTIPSDATVRRNGEKAQLSDIKSGDSVTVVQSPKGTFVDAFDAQHEPKLQMRIVRPGSDHGPDPRKGEGPPLPPKPPEDADAGISTVEQGAASSSS